MTRATIRLPEDVVKQHIVECDDAGHDQRVVRSDSGDLTQVCHACGEVRSTHRLT